MRAAITVAGSLLLVLVIFTSEALSKVSQRSTDEEVATADEKRPKESGRDSRSGLVNAHHRAVSNNARHHESKGQEEFPDGEEQKELDEYGSDNEADNEGSSRSVGGAPAGIPPEWLILSWYLDKRRTDNLLAGIMVRLNDNLVLAHKDTCTKPQGQYYHMLQSGKKVPHKQIQFGPKEKIDVKKGPGAMRAVGCQFLTGKHIGQDIYVYKLIDETDDYMAWFYMQQLLLKTKPQIQNNPYDNDECYLHSYSGNSDANGLEGAERHYIRLRVFLKDCSGDSCTFKTILKPQTVDNLESGRVCPRSSDTGAPIVCGRDEKLSYITLPFDPNPKDNFCAFEFKTLRLSDHFKELDSDIRMKNTLPRAPDKKSQIVKPPFNINQFG